MDQKRSLILPKENGKTEEVETAQSVILIGANGAGKTRLGSWIEIDSPQKNLVHRISAQKSLVMPDSTTPMSIEMAEQSLLFGNKDWDHRHKFHKWSKKPATTMLSDFDKLMVYLFSDETEANAKFKVNCKLSKDRVVPPVTKLDQVKALWEKILPHRELIVGGLRIQTQVKGSEGQVYNSSDMSDGERVIFYLIGQCLAAQESGIIIIDEPEIHLHKSVQAPLWREIENLRPDCLFVYMTHDVDFTVALHESEKVWLKSFDGSSWDWELVPNIDGLPESLLIEILGSRKPVVFVEGENGSHDVSLYRAILNEFLIVPSGSCSQVIQTVKTLKASAELHHMEVYGVIDRDRRVDGEIQALMQDGVYTLDVAEVENLFCVPEIIALVSEKLVRDVEADQKSVEEFVMKKISSELENQVSMRVASEIKYRLNCFNEKAKGAEGLKEALNALAESIDVDGLYNESESLFKEVAESNDYLMTLKLFNRKSLSSQVSQHLGLSHGQLAEFVVRMANSKDGDNIKQALRPYFGGFTEKIL